jgi:selenium-binding protein 1
VVAELLLPSCDGGRLCVSSSLYWTWDDQSTPGTRSWLLRIDCDENGGMELDPGFFADFHDRPDRPARAHEVRLQNGDCTTEIFQ